MAFFQLVGCFFFFSAQKTMEEAQFRCKQNLNMLSLTCEISKSALSVHITALPFYSKHLVTAERLWENYMQCVGLNVTLVIAP